MNTNTGSIKTNFYGQDFARYINENGIIDISPTLAYVTGQDVLVQSLISRQMCAKGSIIDAPNEGIDLRTFIREGLTPQTLVSIPSLVQKELLRDERVQSVAVTGRFDTVLNTLYLIENIVPLNSGPFTLTLAVSALTVQLIDNSP